MNTAIMLGYAPNKAGLDHHLRTIGVDSSVIDMFIKHLPNCGQNKCQCCAEKAIRPEGPMYIH